MWVAIRQQTQLNAFMSSQPDTPRRRGVEQGSSDGQRLWVPDLHPDRFRVRAFVRDDIQKAPRGRESLIQPTSAGTPIFMRAGKAGKNKSPAKGPRQDG